MVKMTEADDLQEATRMYASIEKRLSGVETTLVARMASEQEKQRQLYDDLAVIVKKLTGENPNAEIKSDAAQKAYEALNTEYEKMKSEIGRKNGEIGKVNAELETVKGELVQVKKDYDSVATDYVEFMRTVQPRIKALLEGEK